MLRRTQVQHSRRSVSLPLSSLADVNSFSRKSCSYSKLPEEPIKLSVRKLDGSSFDVEVIKSATIAELKLAVQHVFSHMPKNGPGMISWPHVWGHFCLCYDGLKLLTDTDHIMNYDIKDGDQLHFIRHVTSSYNLTKIQSKKRMVAQTQSYPLISSSWGTSASEQIAEEDDGNEDNVHCKTRNNKKQSMVVQQECQFGQLWRGWSSKIFQLWGTAKYSPKR
ncbi:hypothetical protein HRI_002518000 [Hibiscus trionum]|uniref:Ubiquitin-like domain-containing protein n=1 Tax=Hibiscus trionum TaxID=183268 RepID=A0A9W7M3M5_HIBTR|nr:hypothetical protein HRI_002518000 [Hibiscus trionum]